MLKDYLQAVKDQTLETNEKFKSKLVEHQTQDEQDLAMQTAAEVAEAKVKEEAEAKEKAEEDAR